MDNFLPLIITSDESFHDRRQLPEYTQVISVSAVTGQPSPVGCGWNVLFILGFVNRGFAQIKIDMIVYVHDLVGGVINGPHELHQLALAAHPGLSMTTIAEIIRPRIPPNLLIGYRQWMFPPERTGDMFTTQIQRMCFPTIITSPFAYVIIKLLYNAKRNIGHTILLQFSRREDGTYNCYSFDAQLNRLHTFEEFIEHLISRPVYVGICVIGITPIVGGKTKNMRKRNKTKKMKGGFNFKMIKPLDPELNPMSGEDYKIYMNGMMTTINDEPSKLLMNTKSFDFTKKIIK